MTNYLDLSFIDLEFLFAIIKYYSVKSRSFLNLPRYFFIYLRLDLKFQKMFNMNQLRFNILENNYFENF